MRQPSRRRADTASTRPAGATPSHAQTGPGAALGIPAWGFSDRMARGVRWMLAVLLVVAASSYLVGLAEPRFMLLTVAALAVVAVVWPIRQMSRLSDLVSPWAFVVAAVFIGVMLHVVYIVFELSDPALIDRMALRGQPYEYFFLPGALLVLGLFLVAAGYMWVPSARIKPARFVAVLERYEFKPRTLHVVVGICGLIAFLAFLMFARETGGLDLSAPSQKRASAPGTVAAEDYRGLGYLRFAAALGASGFFALLVHYATQRRRLSLLNYAFLAVLFLNACLLPFYASSRSGILWIILLSIPILLHGGRRVRMRHIIIATVAVFLVVYAMGVLRSRGDVEDVAAGVSVPSMLEALIVNPNSIDLAKTAHVVNNIPEVLDYKYGETIYAWILAPVPREIWPGKPVIQAGPEIGTLLYGHPRAGVPPGFVAEMYWNFHIPGVIIGCLLLGLGLRVLHEKTSPRGRPRPAVILVYCVGVMRLGMLALGGTIGQAIYLAIVDTLQVLAILWLSGVRGPGTSPWRWPVLPRSAALAERS